jgi:hypothetical protein
MAKLVILASIAVAASIAWYVRKLQARNSNLTSPDDGHRF